MILCPFCDRELKAKNAGNWACECGETIPFGMETDDEQNCTRCSVIHCPRRK